MHKESTLVVDSIFKTFGFGKSTKMVVNGVSFSVRTGEVVALLGPNGAGKTTCFSIISGLIRPSLGNIFLDEKNITRSPMYKRALLGVGYLPQEPSVFRNLTVTENILAALEMHESDACAISTKLESYLKDFTISHLRNEVALKLSGGERRRVEIARTIASNPKFIMLDEPLAGIDPIAIKDMRNLIGHLKERGIGIVITDHNVRDTLSIADRVLVIFDGKVIAQGDPEQIINDDLVREVYLGEAFN